MPTRRQEKPHCCVPSTLVAQPVVWHAAEVHGQSLNPVLVPGGRSFVGVDKPIFVQDGEGPERPTQLRSYYLEAEAVTVSRFANFIDATGYITDAERLGSSFVFSGTSDHEVPDEALTHIPWWSNVKGACWNKPDGPESSVDLRGDHPVTHVTWNDAMAFASWVRGRLPTEAEWEHAARGGAVRRRFPWGDEEPDDKTVRCNIWQGRFPTVNFAVDGYEGTAPVRSFAAYFGFYNMVGNVWEWTNDAFRVHSIKAAAKKRNAYAKRALEKTLKGGSYLCHISYCYRYRIAARMALSPDSSASNVGFRVAYDVED